VKQFTANSARRKLSRRRVFRPEASYFAGADLGQTSAPAKAWKSKQVRRGGYSVKKKQTNKLHGLSPRANYTDRATAACRRNECQLLRIKGTTWSA
jgi:hypothetical protein